jgi:hypothetical protein
MTVKNSQPFMGNIKYDEGLDFRKILNDSLSIFFKDAWRVTLNNPSQAYHFLRTIRWQQKATRIRSKWEEQDFRVPPMLIFSITNQCNLHCKGCYNWALRPSLQTEIDVTKLKGIITEARDLGDIFCHDCRG